MAKEISWQIKVIDRVCVMNATNEDEVRDTIKKTWKAFRSGQPKILALIFPKRHINEQLRIANETRL